MKKIYLFDFDDTIYKGDSFVHFTFFSQTFINFLFFWISVIIQLSAGKSKSEIKESFFFRFKDMRVNDFKILCKNFYKKKIKKNIKESFIKYLNKIEKDDQIVIVSASIGDYIEPFCKEQNIHLISTELEIRNNKLTGIFTDGDVRRLLIKVQKPFSALLSEDIYKYANKYPLTVRPNIPLYEAIKLMGEKKIWDLPVVNNQSKFLGLLHLHPAIEKLIN